MDRSRRKAPAVPFQDLHKLFGTRLDRFRLGFVRLVLGIIDFSMCHRRVIIIVLGVAMLRIIVLVRWRISGTWGTLTLE